MTRVALVLMLFARAVFADDVVSPGPLAMHARTDLVLGVATEAEIHLRRGAASLVTSAGVIDSLVADGAGQRATLHLPAQHNPQIVLVAALDANEVVIDWLAVPLAGQAKVTVATAPNASVIVRIAGHELEPVIADGAGVAKISIVVAAGVHDATTIATSRNGNHTEKPLALGVPPFARTFAVCSPSRQQVSVLAIDNDGAPAADPPAVAISAGTLGVLVRRSPGVFEAPISADRDAVSVTASFAGQERVATSCELRIPPEAPRDATLVADRASFVAGSGPLALHVELAFAGQRRPVATTTSFTADLGAIDGDHWTIPDAFTGHRQARVQAHVTWPGGHLERALVVALAPAAAVRLDVIVPARLRADGDATAELVVRVLDRFGNPVAGVAPHARGRGRISPFAQRADDAFVARYTSPRDRIAGDDAIEIAADSLTSRATVSLEPLPKQIMIGAQLGYLSNFGLLSTVVGAVSGDLRIPVLHDHFVAGAELAGYRTSFTATAMNPAETISAHVTTIPILARLAYRTPLGPTEIWLGAGAGTAIAATSLASPSAGTTTTTTARLAASGFTGISTRVSVGTILLEAAYLYATLPPGPLEGRIGGLTISAGYAYEL